MVAGGIDRAWSTGLHRRSNMVDEVRRPGLLLSLRLSPRGAATNRLPRPRPWRRERTVPGGRPHTVRAARAASFSTWSTVGGRSAIFCVPLAASFNQNSSPNDSHSDDNCCVQTVVTIIYRSLGRDLTVYSITDMYSDCSELGSCLFAMYRSSSIGRCFSRFFTREFPVNIRLMFNLAIFRCDLPCDLPCAASPVNHSYQRGLSGPVHE